MRITRTRKAIATGAAALGVMLGAAGITTAATNSGAANQASAETAQAPSYQSSITAPDNAVLDGLAKITREHAAATAANATGGIAGKVELENENGNVVYGVAISMADGTKLDVKIDAGNGGVLAKESDKDQASASGAKESTSSEPGEASGAE